MATFSNGQVVYGLSATGTPATTSTNTTGSVQIGVTPTVSSILNAKHAYAFKATATTTNGWFEFTMSNAGSSAIVATYSGVTLQDGDANDFEGNPLVAATDDYSYHALFQCTVASTASGIFISNGALGSYAWILRNGISVFSPVAFSDEALRVTIPRSGDYIIVNIVAN